MDGFGDYGVVGVLLVLMGQLTLALVRAYKTRNNKDKGGNPGAVDLGPVVQKLDELHEQNDRLLKMSSRLLDMHTDRDSAFSTVKLMERLPVIEVHLSNICKGIEALQSK